MYVLVISSMGGYEGNHVSVVLGETKDDLKVPSLQDEECWSLSDEEVEGLLSQGSYFGEEVSMVIKEIGVGDEVHVLPLSL